MPSLILSYATKTLNNLTRGFIQIGRGSSCSALMQYSGATPYQS